MKKHFFLTVVIAGALIAFFALAKTGVIKIESISDIEADDPVNPIKDISELESGKVYVYHGKDLDLDSKKDGVTTGEFLECGFTEASFDIAKNYKESGADKSHVLWVKDIDEKKVPVLDANTGDRLVYCLSDMQELLPISCERYICNGYTIGLSNMEKDKGDHVFLRVYKNDKEARNVINQGSDATEIMPLAELSDGGVIYLDAVGDKKIKGDTLTPGGAVAGLHKGKRYVCSFYTGTYYQDYMMTADHCCFSGYPNEFFLWKDYRFLHSNIIEIGISDYIKSGYYLINGAGLFRYVAKGDTLESATEEPIILYDEDGNMVNPEVFSFYDID